MDSSPQTNLFRRSHLNLRTASSQTRKRYSDTTPSHPNPLRLKTDIPTITILLVAHTCDDDLRRAGLDIIKNIKNKSRRNSRVNPTNPATQVQLHILLLKPDSAVNNDDEAKARSNILARLRSSGNSVHLHLVPVTSHRLSLSVSTSTAPSALRRALHSGQLKNILDSGIHGAAFVCAPRGAEAQQAETFKTFTTLMGEYFSTTKTPASVPRPVSTSTSSSQSPFVTLYLPRHPYLSDFDFDLPLEEQRAVSVVREAAAHFAQGSGSGTRQQDAIEQTRSMPLLSQSTDGNRRSSFAPPPFLPPVAREGDQSAKQPRPLLLRPAPTAGAQSIAMRLSIPASSSSEEEADRETQDLVLRVTEALTPPVSPNEGLKPLLLQPRPASVRSTSPSSRPSSIHSFPSSTMSARGTLPTIPSSPTPSSSSSSSPRGPKLQLVIPPSPTMRPATPSSAFSPDSETCSPANSNSPLTPSSSTTTAESPAAAPFEPSKHSPICKLPPARLLRSETTSSADGGFSPNTQNVRSLLWERVRRSERRGVVPIMATPV
ncbi:hypothetical protein T439DRAFT_377153 [Meredithblackwellia eburnea MCA 4105]